MARAKARAVYAADFETTTDPDDCRVWGYGLADVMEPDSVELGHTIDEFIARMSGERSICYFHNLRFDGHFIIDWMLKNGYEYAKKCDYAGSFSALISDSGKFYSITVAWMDGGRTEFRDSLKKLPMSVARIAESFKLGESKGDIDYHAARPLGYQMTAEEADYIRRDVAIVAKAVKQIHVDNNMKRLTIGSDSLAEYKSKAPIRFDRMFPTLSHRLDAHIRKAYRGGYTYADPRYKGRLLGGGITLDVNSLYPHIMRSCLIPYGEPSTFSEEWTPTQERPLAIFGVTFTARLKPGHLPCIQIKGSSMFVPTEYVSVVSEPTQLMVTHTDWELYNEHYDINVISYDGGYAFNGALGLFDEYIEHWAKVKEHSTGGIREIAKLHLNSLYGKLATNPNITGKEPHLKDGRVVYRRGPEEVRSPVYTAAGAYITAHARALTIRAAQQNYGTFAYADTDSLHLLTDDVPEALDVHDSRMGAWQLEYRFKNAYYIRAKAYLEQLHDGSYINRIAGLPTHLSAALTFDDIQDGLIIDGKLTPKSVPGGVVLVDTPYELRLD